MDRVGHIVRRRAVFFVPGFDPAPPRALRERYRREAAKQARLSGHVIQISADGSHAWRVDAVIEGQACETRIEVLAWSDLVRAEMRGGGVWRSFANLTRAAMTYIRAGAIAPLFSLRKGPVIAISYPVLVVLTELLVAALLVVAGAQFGPIGALVGGVAGYAALSLAARKDPIFAHYLIDDYAYAAREDGAYPPALEARLAAFQAKLAAACLADYDEVLLIGHSSGAYLAVSLMADLRRAGGAHPALSLMTLGHVVPMVSFLPRATRLRGDLAGLSQDQALTWVDISAPADGCCFALCDPVAVSGVAPDNECWPLVISAAFSQTLTPATWAALRWRLFETHFQYLNAFDGGGDYDYFALTAGGQSLAARYGARTPSPSRITRAVSPHRGVI